MKIFPGLHLSRLYIGIENLRLNNIELAAVDFRAAHQLCPHDMVTMNQLGLVEYHRANYEGAIEWFNRAKEANPDADFDQNMETIHLNLGHCLRKMRKHQEALNSYQLALKCNPTSASTHTVIGFCHHLQNSLSDAIESYTTAMRYDPSDSLAKELMETAAIERLNMPDDVF